MQRFIKAKQVKEGKIKESKLLPEIGEEEKPFELPSGWQFVWKSNLQFFKWLCVLAQT